MPSCGLATGGLTTRMCFRPRGAPLSVDDVDRRLQQPLGQLAGVGDGGAGADEDRVGAVVAADPPKAANDVGDVAAEQPAIGVQLVDDDELQVLEQLEPLGVVRKDRRVEHVRVGDGHLARAAHHAADGGRRVAVVGVGLEGDIGRLGQRAQLHQLVGGQRLGGEEVQGAGGLVAGHRVDDGQVVAERLARCGGRDDADVAAGAHRLDGRGLVRVERLEAPTAQRVDQPRIEPVRPRRVAGRLRLHHAVRGDQPRDGRVAEERADRVVHGARAVEDHRCLLVAWTRLRSERAFDYGSTPVL